MTTKAKMSVSGSGRRAKFDETKHRRGGPGNKGQFANQAGKGDDAPKKGRAKPTAAEQGLKSSGVGPSDRIVVLSARSRRYQGFETVGAFVDSHPKGRAYALRALAADHAKGAIGFSAAGYGSAASTAPKPKATPKPKAAPEASGVTGTDTIVLRSTRLRSYAEGQTVQEFVDGHPKGKAYALRKLTADRKKGAIGFEGAAQGQAVGTAAAGRERASAGASSGWNGAAARRDIDRDEILIGDDTFRQGLFREEAQLRAASAALLAGIPGEERLTIRWAPGARPNSLVLAASNKKGTVKISRNFVQQGDSWTVRHTVFQLPKRYQGGGNARTMLRSSVEAYDGIGVRRIEAHANINVGGYAWAKLGFAADNPAAVREAIEKGIRRAPRSPQAQAARRVLDTSSDDDLMFNLARAQGADGERLGRKILGPKADWDGHLDLKNARHRERLNGSFT